MKKIPIFPNSQNKRLLEIVRNKIGKYLMSIAKVFSVHVPYSGRTYLEGVKYLNFGIQLNS